MQYSLSIWKHPYRTPEQTWTSFDVVLLTAKAVNVVVTVGVVVGVGVSAAVMLLLILCSNGKLIFT